MRKMPECLSCKAIKTPFQIDNQACLSHRLQHKGKMDEKTMAHSDIMMYGCDICQNVCPYNENALMTPEPMFKYKDEERWLDLPELLQLSNREFNRRYRSAAFGWRGRRVMQRNALKSLGNTGNPLAVKYVEAFLGDHREDVQAVAKWAKNRLTHAIYSFLSLNWRKHNEGWYLFV